jgi:hypothetical protein
LKSNLCTFAPFRWFNPQNGSWAEYGMLEAGIVATIESPDNNPWVLIATQQ